MHLNLTKPTYFNGIEIHLVFGFLVVIAFSSSSKSPGFFLIFLTSCRIAFSHNLLWLDSEDWLIRWELTTEAVFASLPLASSAELLLLSKLGFTLKPKSFFTIAGVIYRLEKCVVSIDIFDSVYVVYDFWDQTSCWMFIVCIDVIERTLWVIGLALCIVFKSLVNSWFVLNIRRAG